jgi:hypothetical protein
MTITFNGTGTLAGTGTQDGQNTVVITFTPSQSPPPPSPPPPPGVSADGTYSCPNGAALTDGQNNVWTWNAAGNAVLRNGTVPVGGGGAFQMLVQDGGRLYVYSGQWWEWQLDQSHNAGFLPKNPSVIPPACP